MQAHMSCSGSMSCPRGMVESPAQRGFKHCFLSPADVHVKQRKAFAGTRTGAGEGLPLNS